LDEVRRAYPSKRLVDQHSKSIMCIPSWKYVRCGCRFGRYFDIKHLCGEEIDYMHGWFYYSKFGLVSYGGFRHFSTQVD